MANVQRELAALGYQHHGHPLKNDGDFDPTTRGAVEDFQRKHGLDVDGKVGNDTAEALKHATLQQSALTALTLDHPQHPGHPIYQQALAGIGQLDQAQGRATDWSQLQTPGMQNMQAPTPLMQSADVQVAQPSLQR